MLDMSKAYDHVEWHYLQQMMNKMSFCNRWIQVIMKCVDIVTFSVLFNGISQRQFKPSRGLRQGDPLSPYLFLISFEGFSTLLQKKRSDMLFFQDCISILIVLLMLSRSHYRSCGNPLKHVHGS